MISNLLSFFDDHEGAGSWLAAIGTFTAIGASLMISTMSYVAQRRDKMERERDRLSILTQRDEVHDCLQITLSYEPRERSSGVEARIKIAQPAYGYLIEAVRRPVITAAARWSRTSVGSVQPMKVLVAPFTRIESDSDLALRAAFYVVRGPGDNWQIDRARLKIEVFALGGSRPLFSTDVWVSPAGEDPKLLALSRRPI